MSEIDKLMHLIEEAIRTKQDVHILPENDIRKHESSEDCWCSPNKDEDLAPTVNVYAHNSADGRERKPS